MHMHSSASTSGNRKSSHTISSVRLSRNNPSTQRVVEPFSIQSTQVNTRVREPSKTKKSKCSQRSNRCGIYLSFHSRKRVHSTKSDIFSDIFRSGRFTNKN